jgi:aminopeptidase
MRGRDFADATRQLAELAVGFGANVQPGQIVGVTSFVGKEALTRDVTRAAYERGARWVDVLYFDQWLKRERVARAPADSLDFVPPWLRDRLRWLSDEHAARISLTGPQAPTALDGLDPGRAGRDLLPYLPEVGEVVNARTTNWTVVPAPTLEWAEAVYPDLPPDEAYERLWDAVIHICRLDADDPVAAWESRGEALRDVAGRLTERRFDRIHLHGPGTDLTVGLLPSSSWQAVGAETVEGIRHHVNVPSEETFTTPDPTRADGYATATMPKELYGSMISGIRVEFQDGRAVKIDADVGADALRAAAAKDEGASRLGEVALVDRHGRIGPLETVFYDTLIDENAASHIAIGHGYAVGVEDETDVARVNVSSIHVDFMVGRPELEVDGLTQTGERVPLLRGGDWQL